MFELTNEKIRVNVFVPVKCKCKNLTYTMYNYKYGISPFYNEIVKVVSMWGFLVIQSCIADYYYNNWGNLPTDDFFYICKHM